MEPVLIQQKIYEIRGSKVMLDFDLAELYGTETRILKQAVKRNEAKFPKHFMFQLKKKEWQKLITSGDNLPDTVKFSPALPYAFTEHGVLQLASVLKSDQATAMSIRIIEVFIKMREILLSHKDILLQLEKIEAKLSSHDEDIQLIFQYLKQLLKPAQPPRRKIGFKRNDEE
jgi:hypothetical protein